MASSEDMKKDCGWKYGYLANLNRKGNVTCKFCGKEGKGGIYRHKQHLVGGFRTITACPNCPEHVKEEIREYMLKKKIEKEEQTLPDYDTVGLEDEDDDVSMVVHSHGKRAVSVRNGSNKKPREGRQAIKHDKKKQRDKACADIARWLYEAAIPFNAIKFDSFRVAIDSIGRYGVGMKPPSYHEVRVPLLKKELDHINDIMKNHQEEWEKTGCSIMSDRLQDRSGRNLMNFLVNCSKGSMFIESVDASLFMKTEEKLFELISRMVDKVGAASVIQVITENDSSYAMAGKLLEAKYPNLYWTPCAAHCVDQMLEDIGKLPAILRSIRQAIELNGYIYNRTGVLNMMRRFTGKKSLLKPAKTRFATSFVTLSRLHKQRNNLRKMFTSEEWISSKWSKEQLGKKAAQTVLMPSFWNGITYALKVTNPLVCVLRLVDGERKPAMCYIYKAMDQAKEAITASFKENEDKYKQIFEIIDHRWECQLHKPLHAAAHFLNPEYFYDNPTIEQDENVNTGLYQCIQRLVSNIEDQDKITRELTSYRKADGLFGSPLAVRHRKMMAPAEWWSSYGSSAPNLQQFAIKVLSLTCSSLGSERDWNVFEHVHSKKRNRLAQSRVNDLLYIRYNRALMQRYKLRAAIDPISLRDVDDANEWLTGRMEEDCDGDDLVLDNGRSLAWGDTVTASGVEEERLNTGSNMSRPRGRELASSSSIQLVHNEREDETEEEDDEGYRSSDDNDDDTSLAHAHDMNNDGIIYNFYVRRKKRV